MKEVTAAILLREDSLLIAQRGDKDPLTGKWELPGGKIEAGETPQDCLKREIKEELAVDIEVLDFFAESVYRYPQGTIKLMAYYCRWLSGKYQLKVHRQIRWVKPWELDGYDFAPADIPLVERLKETLHE